MMWKWHPEHAATWTSHWCKTINTNGLQKGLWLCHFISLSMLCLHVHVYQLIHHTDGCGRVISDAATPICPAITLLLPQLQSADVPLPLCSPVPHLLLSLLVYVQAHFPSLSVFRFYSDCSSNILLLSYCGLEQVWECVAVLLCILWYCLKAKGWTVRSGGRWSLWQYWWLCSCSVSRICPEWLGKEMWGTANKLEM